MEYFATITEAANQRWLVSFPDCSCSTFGHSETHALAMATEALEGWLSVTLQHGELPPRPITRRGEAVRVRPRLAIAIELRWLRDARGLSRAELAGRAGVREAEICELEDPDQDGSLRALEAVAGALGAELGFAPTGALPHKGLSTRTRR